MDTGDKKDCAVPKYLYTMGGGYSTLYLGNQARNLKSDNLSFD